MNRNSPNVLRRPQQGGTCWFHGIINGLLMSWKARHLLEKRIAIVETNIGGRSLFSQNSPCLSRNASGNLFWSYISHRLSGKGKVNARYANSNVIRNLGIRRKNSPNVRSMIPRLNNTKRSFMRRFVSARTSVFGGTFSDLLNVYDKLFPGEVSMMSDNLPTTFVIKKGKNFANPINHAGKMYSLSHAFIQVMTPGSLAGHVLTGYISRLGNYNLYDSGYDVNFTSFSWYNENSDKYIIQWIRENYHFPVTKVSKWAIYIRV